LVRPSAYRFRPAGGQDAVDDEGIVAVAIRGAQVVVEITLVLGSQRVAYGPDDSCTVRAGTMHGLSPRRATISASRSP
jgi:hypothetical protein